MSTSPSLQQRIKHLLLGSTLALATTALAVPSVLAGEKDSFRVAWSIYAGWMPWEYIDESGLMDKWADKYDITVEITQINDYIESINQYTAGRYDAVTATSMDALSIPAAGGVDTTALIVGDYSNGNDGIVMKDSDNIADMKGQSVNLVELSVSHYLLAQALESVGLQERDIRVVNTGDADIVSAFSTDGVRNAVAWNPQLNTMADKSGSNLVFDSSQIPGHIKDMTIVNTQVLEANPKFGKALAGAWFEAMAIMQSDSQEGRDMREMLGEAAGTDRAGYERQLEGMFMFWEAADAVEFITGEKAYQAMDDVRQFSWDKGLLGENAPNADFIGIEFSDGKILGNSDNIKLRFNPRYMQMVADGEL